MDDPVVREVGAEFEGPSISFGLTPRADFYAADIRAGLKGTDFKIHAGSLVSEMNFNLLGTFSVYNALAAAAAARSVGAEDSDIEIGLEEVRKVPGRFEVVSPDEGPTVVVDYAHTPDALENILRFCRELGAERVITVFGCGGDRDRGKRPMMGGIASRLSDKVYVTSDNPRTEKPEKIIEDIMEGIESGSAPVRVVPDRREAIREAVLKAQADELVIIAGKGHEEYQVIGKERIQFSDAEEARRALENREVGNRNQS
jgi:UDP-N-acetylmuramoyl-L-alanyl-D-glutamate--2,6-diaminopimelate ligase